MFVNILLPLLLLALGNQGIVSDSEATFLETNAIHEWRIKDLSKQRGDFYSKEFPVNGYNKWNLHLIINSTGQGAFGLYLYLKGSNFRQIKVNFTHEVVFKNGSALTFFNITEKTFGKDEVGSWGRDKFTSRSELLKWVKNSGDELTIRTRIEYIHDRASKLISGKMVDCQNNLVNDLLHMLKSQKYHDIVLRSRDGKEIKAHAVILAARSPVFQLMFRNISTNLEKREALVLITDFGYETMSLLVSFIYGGRVNNWDMTINEKKNLMLAASKYELNDLKSLLEEFLINDVTLGNALDLLILSVQADAPKLKEKLINLLSTKDAKNLLNDPKWTNIKKQHPDILLEIYWRINKKICSS